MNITKKSHKNQMCKMQINKYINAIKLYIYILWLGHQPLGGRVALYLMVIIYM